jgi:cytochrome c biogenesis protein CcdA
MRLVVACLILVAVAALGWLAGSRMGERLGMGVHHDSPVRRRPIFNYLTINRFALVITIFVVLFGIAVAVLARHHVAFAIGIWIVVFALLQIVLIWLQVRRDRARAAESQARRDATGDR